MFYTICLNNRLEISFPPQHRYIAVRWIFSMWIHCRSNTYTVNTGNTPYRCEGTIAMQPSIMKFYSSNSVEFWNMSITCKINCSRTPTNFPCIVRYSKAFGGFWRSKQSPNFGRCKLGHYIMERLTFISSRRFLHVDMVTDSFYGYFCVDCLLPYFRCGWNTMIIKND